MASRLQIPDDFAEHAPVLSLRDLSQRYGVTVTTVGVWKKALGITRTNLPVPVREFVPADFATFAPGKPMGFLARHYGTTEWAIRQWREKTGVEKFDRRNAKPVRRTKRPMPADFPENAGQLTRWLAAHYRTGSNMVTRWRKEAGFVSPVGNYRLKKAVPADFAEMATKMCKEHLARHYVVSAELVRRWCRESGVQPVAFAPPKAAASFGGPRLVHSGGGGHRRSVFAIPPRDTSIEGSAADFLRCHARTPVYRCGEKGAADPNGGWWRYGNAVLAPDELLHRAARHGWRWSEAA